LVWTLGFLGEAEVQKIAHERFARFVADQTTLGGDLRDPVLKIVGREADAATWDQLHDLAQRADSFEQKRLFYSALASAHDPKLAERTLALSLADELIAPDAARLVQRVAGEAEQPELAWNFARQHLDTLLAKVSALSANGYVPRIFEAFDDPARADELEAFAAKNLPASAKVATAKAADNIRFRAELKARVLPQIDAWWQAQVGR
jgi:aminopeptidase N